MVGSIGTPAVRMDGRAKVTGTALYAADVAVDRPAWAFLVTSAIARGRVRGFDLAAARAVPGVLDVLTHEELGGEVADVSFFGMGGYTSTTIRPLHDSSVRHDGQIIAVVLAESYEAAREAAYRVGVDYAADAPSAGFDSPGTTEHAAALDNPKHEDPKVGDAERAFAAAPVRVEARYSTPTQHHNAIELFSTTASWHGDEVTIHEPSQFVWGMKNGLARQLGISPEKIRVISRYVGGAFGGKGSVTQRTALIALAARRLGRPVKLVATRDQNYTIGTYRAETRHHVRLAATSDGKLQAYLHEGWEVTSRPDAYVVGGTKTTAHLYACPNVLTKVHMVHADRNTPGFMRSPPEVPYVFALESAMDELACQLRMDPVALRKLNDTLHEPIKGLPFTSRSLIQCWDQASAAFDWARRTPEPRSMRDGDWLVGLGCATAYYPSQMCPAAVRVMLRPDGTARVQVAAHDVGTGAYTVVAITAADRLGVAVDKVAVEMGDSILPPGPVAGGSNTTASVCNAVAIGCDRIRGRLVAAATAGNGLLHGRDPSSLTLRDGSVRAPDGAMESLATALGRLSNGPLEVDAEFIPHGAPPSSSAKMYEGQVTMVGGPEDKDRIAYAFGAEFVEVRVHARTREVRVPRVVGAFAAGTIVNPRTARSQLMGGLIWGISAALHEETEMDHRAARYVNDNLSEYLVPVNADIQKVEVILVPEQDSTINPLGIKGLGELGNVGTNAAVANAVFHATGTRIRDLPIRIEKLL